MKENVINILLIEDNPGDARLIREMLIDAKNISFNLEHVERLETGLARLSEIKVDVVLLDLTLPDSQGLDTFAEVQRLAPDAPILLLTGLEDEMLAFKAVQAGAQDYLAKGDMDELLLVRAIRYAIERVRSQKALRDSEERHRRLVELMPDGVAVHSEGKIVFLNAAGLKIIGADSLEEAVGRSIFDFIHPDYLEATHNRAQQIAAGQPTVPLKQEFIRLDGTSVEVEVTATPYSYEGKPAVLVVFRDITEQRQTIEEIARLKDFNESIIQNMNEGIAVEDREGLFTFINPAAAAMLGYAPEDLLGQHWTTIVPSEQQAVVQAANERRLQRTADRYEVEFIRPDGTQQPVLVSGSPRFDPNTGRFEGAMAVFTDISKRKEAEEELRQRAAQLTLIHEIGGQIAGVLELDSVLYRAANLIQETFDYHHVALFLADGDLLRLKAVAGSYKPYFRPGYSQKLSEGINGWVASYGEKIVANDISIEPRYTSLIVAHSVTQAELCLPIKVAGETVGVLNIQSPHQNAFSQNDVVAMEALTHQIAATIENARLYEAMQTELNERKQAEEKIRRRNRELTLLNQVIATSMEALEIEAILEVACRELARAFETSRTTALLFDTEKQEAIIAAEFCPNCPTERIGLTVPITDNAVLHFLLTHAGPVVIDNLRNDPRLASYKALSPQYDPISLLLLPIRVKEEIWGTLILETLEPRSFSTEEMNLAWSVADQVAGVLVRARLSEERLRTEIVLRENEERFRRVVSSISDHIYVSEITIKGEHLNLYLSPNVEALTGYPLEKFMADPKFWALSVIHPDDQGAAASQLDCFRKGENGEAEYRLIRADGKVIWVRDSGKVHPLGGSLIIYGVVGDITERKQAEEEVRMRARQQAVVAELGQRALAGIKVLALMDEAVSLIAQTLKAEYCGILEWLPGDEALLLRASIGWQAMTDSKTRMPGGGDSQAGYTLLTNEPVVVEDISQETRFVADQMLHKYGIISSVSVVIHGGTNGHSFGVLGVHTTEQRMFTEDDVYFLQAVANILTQAIERKQAHEALENEKTLLAERVEERTAELSSANAELSRATRLKDEFLANMSHELRTPLNAVLGMSEVLRENIYGPMNEDQLNALGYIEEGGRHLLELINDILDLSKIEAGKLELNLGPVSVENVCQISLRFIKQIAQKKRIKVFSSLDQSISTIQADERRLKQVLVNLLSNAVKFTPEGGEVSLKVSGDKAQNVVRFAVSDSGIGIAPEDMERLFRPFVQLDSKLSRQHEGTGLGLSLVSRLVEMHGGGVGVESVIGEGSTFTIALPWSDPVEAVPPGRKETTNGPVTMGRSEARQALIIEDSPGAAKLAELPLILLAEDNEANIMTISAYLKARGYRLIIARNGMEAIQQVKERHPAIILMDIQMPTMDGLEAIRHLRADQALAATPIVALTALAMPGDRERCLAAGANDYLSKPISMRELIQIIEQQLARTNSETNYPDQA